MSTELKPTSKFQLTQFAGPRRDDGGDNRKLQVNPRQASMGSNWKVEGFVNMTKEEATELARALLDWVADDREEA